MAFHQNIRDAIATGDRATIEHAHEVALKRAYERGYLGGVQDQQVNLRYALDTGPLTTPIAWFRFRDDAEVVVGALSGIWEDLRVVDLRP